MSVAGRWLECFTDQPGVQFYTGNFVPTDDSLTGKDGAVYRWGSYHIIYSFLHYTKCIFLTGSMVDSAWRPRSSLTASTSPPSPAAWSGRASSTDTGCSTDLDAEDRHDWMIINLYKYIFYHYSFQTLHDYCFMLANILCLVL